VSKTFDVPETIPMSKVTAFLADLGLDVKDLRQLNIGKDGLYAVFMARDDKGSRYLNGDGELALHQIAIPLDWEA
jgi:hypothetical protein